MSQSRETGILELIAVCAIIYVMWRMTRKTKTIPVSEEPIPDECKNIVYKPLSPVNITSANLLGKGWCYKGDMSVLDYSQGSGTPYMEEQAQEYTEMKQEEAIRATNRSCIQFRLINSSAVAITSKGFNTTEDSNIFDGTDDIVTPDAPTARSATDITITAFTANWDSVINANGYCLDIATDSLFTSYVSGYENKDIGNVLSYNIAGLTPDTAYFYRIRAYINSTTSTSSSTITVSTDALNTDWFLPSRYELMEMYNELQLYGLGDFLTGTLDRYYTSSEYILLGIGYAFSINFGTGSTVYQIKSNEFYVRACRTFISATGDYSLRDLGEKGGYIFHIADNGDGNSTYYECGLADISGGKYAFSNITDSNIGTTGTAIGTGKTNTEAIIMQTGHITSAALQAYNYEV